MVPIRLQLRNFLSYGETQGPLDFTGMHVACLSGNNGHGKSALLEAMTWALWGEARTASADDLVRLGQTSMQVEFDFTFDGNTYRVIRKRTRGRSGQSDLQFQIMNGDGSYRPLTEQGIRATQDRIVQTLRMDYQTFIHSAFLLQGRADDFARKGPMERKRILAEILNLGVYDALTEAARKRARAAEACLAELEATLRRIEDELAHEPEYRAARERAAAEAAQAEVALTAARAEQERWRARKSALETKKARRDDLAKRLAGVRDEIAALTQQRTATDRRIAAARAVLARRDEIEAGVRALTDVRRELAELSERAEALLRLSRERSQVQARLEAARAQIVKDLEIARHELSQLQTRQHELPKLARDETDLHAQIEALDRIEREQTARQEALAVARERQAALRQRLEQLEALLKEDQEKFALLKGATVLCPVCEEPLAPEKRIDLGRKLRRERDEMEREREEKRGEQQKLEAHGRDLRRELDQASRRLETGRVMRDRYAQAKQARTQCEEALGSLPSAQSLVERKEALLREEAFAVEEREQLKGLDLRIAALDYDERQRGALQQRVRGLEGVEKELATLQSAEATLATDEAHLESLSAMIEQREIAIREDVALQESLDEELRALPDALRELAGAETAAEGAALLNKTRANELAVCDDKLARCARLAAEAVEKRTERAVVEKDRLNHDELTRIFGKNGIQALIIENAIPEIENEANLLLARLTDNQMRVTLRTQRDLKNLNVAETLDIDISDELGTRKLECFSGGESFRVHFAIRIALSKLLARRAGAPLQTLVIDEGFGSQDAQGRDRLVEAIHTIQDDFEKILVITHIDELKDAFPTRIEVTKTHLGSQFTVV